MERERKRNKSCPLAFLKSIGLCRMPVPDASPIPKVLNDQLEVLDTFVESAEELIASNYIQQLQENGFSVKRTWSWNSTTTTTSSPDHESAKAVVLTLRMFCQNNDATSLENVETMLVMMFADPTALSSYHNSRANFNAYLNSSPTVGFPSDANANTRRKIWDTFLYGMFAHARIGKRRTINNWRSQPYTDDIRMQFDLIIVEFIKVVKIMSNACKAVAESKRALAS